MLMIELKSNIGELVQKKGLKGRWIAQQLKVTPSQVSNYIQGRSFPTIEKAFQLADILDCKVDDLFERINKKI
ncbi:helix-turn-helix domain-containing protein [Bacillus thuringiensis]|nr:helix-turn-helix transcriptional regulator [Bacillus thuringiensis]